MVIDINYRTKVIKKILITIITGILVYLGFKLAMFYFPFLLAFLISVLLEPLIRFFMRKLKLKRKYSSILIIFTIMTLIVGLLIWGVGTLIEEGSNFLLNINEYMDIATKHIQNIINNINIEKYNIPQSLIKTIENSSTNMLNSILSKTQNIIKYILNIITSIPTIGVYFVITFLSLYFICSDKVYMIDQLEHHIPELWVKKIYKHIKELIKVLGGYIKAQAILILISFIISLIGFYVMYFIGLNVKYPLLYALGICFVDALPIFGSGTIMVPWAVASAFYGDIKLAIYLIILWGIMSIVRQIMEPRLVGNGIGTHPIFTLIAMYTGFKITGIIGLFIGPIVLIVLKNVFGRMIDEGVIKSIINVDY